MAQEAKSPPAGMATGGAGDNPFDIKGTSAGDVGDDAPDPLDQSSGAEGQKKLSLAERLRAEQQRKTSEPKVEEQKPADAGDTASAAAARAAARARRPAGPAPRRIAAAAANDDLPSIGGLIFALQQKPSKSPFLVALVASLVWFVVGGFFVYSLIAISLRRQKAARDCSPIPPRSPPSSPFSCPSPFSGSWRCSSGAPRNCG